MLIRSLARRTYDAVAFFAVLNLAALVALVAYAVASGGVDAEKLERIAAVLRGQDPVTTLPEPAQEEQAEGAEPAPPAGDAAAASSVELEIMRREAERIKEELRQRLALNNSILLRATTEREAFERERQLEENQRLARLQEREELGFTKQVEILEAMKPKIAVAHLLGMDEPDEAARVLLAMNTRQARKIVEAARGGQDMTRMMDVLNRIREVAPDRSAELGDEKAEE